MGMPMSCLELCCRAVFPVPLPREVNFYVSACRKQKNSLNWAWKQKATLSTPQQCQELFMQQIEKSSPQKLSVQLSSQLQLVTQVQYQLINEILMQKLSLQVPLYNLISKLPHRNSSHRVIYRDCYSTATHHHRNCPSCNEPGHGCRSEKEVPREVIQIDQNQATIDPDNPDLQLPANLPAKQ